MIFDLDGVVTRTAAVHAVAWKRMFDEFLRRWADRVRKAFVEFADPHDYLAHVDGRPRYQGVESFLRSRGLTLPSGAVDDPPDAETICGLGNRKNAIFHEIVAAEGVGVYESSVTLIHELRARGVRVGLATSSRNAALILERTGLGALFETVVDGLVSSRLGLHGKPEPDIFTTACANLHVDPARAIVVEDAVAGVQAGARGGFALIVGVAREANARELREHGADVVVTDLAETNLDELSSLVCARHPGSRAS
jgi:beta-phosphoglucomutase family hydrolase